MSPTFPIPSREIDQLDSWLEDEQIEDDLEVEETLTGREPEPEEEFEDILELAPDDLAETQEDEADWSAATELEQLATETQEDELLLAVDSMVDDLEFEPTQSEIVEFDGIGSGEQVADAGSFPGEQEGLAGDISGMVKQGLTSAAVLAAIAAGERDERTLTNKVFFARHPELGGRKIRRDETTLVKEWLQIRDRLVRPLLSPQAGSAKSSAVGRQRMRTQALRDAWAAYARRSDLMIGVDVLGHRPQVNPRIVEAVRALAQALDTTGYRADRVGGFSDRFIKGTPRLSLHAYGIAIDIDAGHNPHRRGRTGPARWSSAATQQDRRADVSAGRADTSFTPEQIAAVRAIRTVDGIPVFFWAGSWAKSPDAMHFQIDVTPAELARGLATSARVEVHETDEETDEPEDEEQENFAPFDFLKSFFRNPTVGFEFDVHYGPIPALPDTRLGDVLSSHSKSSDGFEVKLDGPRLEINTRPFETTDAGRKELQGTAVLINSFAEELWTGCRNATPVGVPGFSGARPFSHPKVTVPIGKLPVGGKFTNCSVWASPQTTLTIPLARVATLVERIKASEGDGPGLALTGGSTARMGLRSEALYRAHREVKKARRAAAFSDDLEGFLILLASYLWTSELPYRFPAPGERVNGAVHDYEQIGKAYLPINVKNPFHQVFKTLLSAADQQVFRNRFADGAARVKLFRLALPAGAALSDGDRKFLPPGRTVSGVPDVVHQFQRDGFFGVVPTWNDLVEHTLDPTHRGWNDRLWVTHSTMKDIDDTRPRVLLELRRAGFVAVDRSKWERFMLRMHELTTDLNR
jgi:D-alanyl-D-alanine carboxypeptidase